MKHLGEDLDIHCGGIDNAFPHHTNEIAQSESYLGHKWCNWWMHVLHLNTNSGKMSKSSGEFLTVSLLEEKGYDPLSYRFFCLQSHYRKALVFTWENLDNAQQAYQKLIARIAALTPSDEPVDEAIATQLKEKFVAAMDNDLNTALAVTALYDVLKGDISDATKLYLIADFEQVLSLGLIEAARAEQEKAAQAEAEKEAQKDAYLADKGITRAWVDEKLAERARAKADKDWATADAVRDELKALGIVIKDSKNGASWETEQ